MEYTSFDSMCENIFSAQNFFSVPAQQEQIEKQNSATANCSLLDLDILRFEVGGGDAFCSGFNDDADLSSSRADDNIMAAAAANVGGVGAVGATGEFEIAPAVSASVSSVSPASSAAQAAEPATAASAYLRLGTDDMENLALAKNYSNCNGNVSGNGNGNNNNGNNCNGNNNGNNNGNIGGNNNGNIINNNNNNKNNNGNGNGNGNGNVNCNGNGINWAWSGNNLIDNRSSPFSGCLWPPLTRQSLPVPSIQIGEEKFTLCRDTTFVLGMRLNVTKNDIITFFGKIGHIKVDERTLKPKIYVYKNKLTGRSRGKATITYTSAYSAQAAIHFLDGSKFLGQTLSVLPAYRSIRPGHGVCYGYAQDPAIQQPRQQKKWKPAIDNWVCQLCQNSNFVWRLNCNRCRVSKSEAIVPSTDNLASSWRSYKYDWTCGHCFNINFWYREECNRCHAVKVEPKCSSDSDKDKWELVISEASIK